MYFQLKDLRFFRDSVQWNKQLGVCQKKVIINHKEVGYHEQMQIVSGLWWLDFFLITQVKKLYQLIETTSYFDIFSCYTSYILWMLGRLSEQQFTISYANTRVNTLYSTDCLLSFWPMLYGRLCVSTTFPFDVFVLVDLLGIIFHRKLRNTYSRNSRNLGSEIFR